MCVRSSDVASAYSGPQTSVSSLRCVISRPRLVRQRAQQRELDRRQVHLLAVERDGVRGEVDDEAVGLDPRLGRGAAGAPQHRLHPRDELAGRERLRDVVVGAVLERLDLGLLVGDRREHDDRQLAPGAQLAADLDARAVGQHQVDDRRVRTADRGAVERLLGGRAGQHLVAGAAQHEAQRAQDLRVVVADEDALAGHQAARRLARGARGLSGSSTTKLVPWPGSDSTEIRPPFDLDEALRDREPEARALMARAAGRASGRTAGRSARGRRGGSPAPGR